MLRARHWRIGITPTLKIGLQLHQLQKYLCWVIPLLGYPSPLFHLVICAMIEIDDPIPAKVGFGRGDMINRKCAIFGGCFFCWHPFPILLRHLARWWFRTCVHVFKLHPPKLGKISMLTIKLFNWLGFQAPRRTSLSHVPCSVQDSARCQALGQQGRWQDASFLLSQRRWESPRGVWWLYWLEEVKSLQNRWLYVYCLHVFVFCLLYRYIFI